MNFYVDFVQGQNPMLRLPVTIDPDVDNKGNNERMSIRYEHAGR